MAGRKMTGMSGDLQNRQFARVRLFVAHLQSVWSAVVADRFVAGTVFFGFSWLNTRAARQSFNE
jgi:hypothetical protein